MDLKIRPRHGTKLRCFVSAPFGCNVEPVISALRNWRVEARRLDSLAPGKSIAQAVSKEIRRSDFVCAVFPQNYNTGSIVFELGFAIGAGIPVIILAEPEVQLPSDVSELAYGRVSLEKNETVTTAISGLLPTLRKPERPSDEIAHAEGPSDRILIAATPKRSSKPLFDEQQAANALKELKKARESDSPVLFEQFVATLFRRAGFLVAAEHAKKDRGVDLAVWVDDLAKTLGGPLLIEIKQRLSNHAAWSRAADQFRGYLSNAGAHYGLLLSPKALPPDIPGVTASIPMVVTLSAEELIQLIVSQDLAKELVQRRNRAVHGAVD